MTWQCTLQTSTWHQNTSASEQLNRLHWREMRSFLVAVALLGLAYSAPSGEGMNDWTWYYWHGDWWEIKVCHCMYRAFFPLSRKVWKMTSWKVPSAGGLILQLPTAQAGPRKLYWNPGQNLATEWKKRSVPSNILNQVKLVFEMSVKPALVEKNAYNLPYPHPCICL